MRGVGAAEGAAGGGQQRKGDFQSGERFWDTGLSLTMKPYHQGPPSSEVPPSMSTASKNRPPSRAPGLARWSTGERVGG